jgi:uncharacterized protein YutE (UPF0331/DUF86 family)
MIGGKINSLRNHLSLLAGYKDLSVEELSSDVTLRGAVERYLYLAAQAAIDLAEAVIAFRCLRKPSTIAESFSILFEAGLISSGLCDRLVRMAGFRNILAHDYERVDPSVLQDVLRHRLADIQQFVRSVSLRLEGSQAGPL